ncbi:MAG: hypothetical protein PHI04_06825, partial [Clostridiaceae bacterium]|nr:hypothetical protein [Clostridiaceae bacterium]
STENERVNSRAAVNKPDAIFFMFALFVEFLLYILTFLENYFPSAIQEILLILLSNSMLAL